MRSNALLILLGCGLLSTALCARDQPRGARLGTPDVAPNWEYRGAQGAQHWGELSSAYAACARGSRQSPIELSSARSARLPALRFQYRSAPLHMHSDDRTLQILYQRGSQLRLGKRRFELRSIEFHTPAEHSIRGRRADMEIQLQHVDGGGNRVNLAITVVAGSRPNAMLERIADYLPKLTRKGEVNHRHVGINPTFFLPSDRSYFRYRGSLTRPPCSETITWMVLREPLEVTASLIERFHEVVGDNSRPLQPTAGRAVSVSR